MQKGDTYYLTTDITKKYFTGLRGDACEIIRKSGPAVIVECRGERITLGEDDLSPNPPLNEPVKYEPAAPVNVRELRPIHTERSVLINATKQVGRKGSVSKLRSQGHGKLFS